MTIFHRVVFQYQVNVPLMSSSYRYVLKCNGISELMPSTIKTGSSRWLNDINVIGNCFSSLYLFQCNISSCLLKWIHIQCMWWNIHLAICNDWLLCRYIELTAWAIYLMGWAVGFPSRQHHVWNDSLGFDWLCFPVSSLNYEFAVSRSDRKFYQFRERERENKFALSWWSLCVRQFQFSGIFNSIDYIVVQ